MDLKVLIIGLSIFGMFITGFWGIAGNIALNTGTPVSKELASLSQAADIENTLDNMEKKLENPFGDGVIGIIYTTIQAGYGIFSQLLSIVENVRNIIYGTIGVAGLPIPSFFIDGLFSIFMIYFVFAFLGYLGRGRG